MRLLEFKISTPLRHLPISPQPALLHFHLQPHHWVRDILQNIRVSLSNVFLYGHNCCSPLASSIQQPNPLRLPCKSFILHRISLQVFRATIWSFYTEFRFSFSRSYLVFLHIISSIPFVTLLCNNLKRPSSPGYGRILPMPLTCHLLAGSVDCANEDDCPRGEADCLVNNSVEVIWVAHERVDHRYILPSC